MVVDCSHWQPYPSRYTTGVHGKIGLVNKTVLFLRITILQRFYYIKYTL